MGHQVFLSYSHKDVDVMRRIRDDLRNAGLNVWVDENLTPGMPSWKSGIEIAIEDTATLAVLLSPDAKKSEWIEKELDYAQTYGILIIPVLVRGDERDAVPFDLIGTQRIDIRTDYDTGIRQLIAATQSNTPLPKRSASQKDTTPNAQISQHQESEQDELDTWNLLDQLRLMWWLFLTPAQLLAYRTHFGAESVEKVTAWLVSTLVWLVTAVPILSLTLGTLTPN